MANKGAEPVRQCAGCRDRKPQSAMQRFARSGGGGWVADTGPKRGPGRGAYLCSAACAKRVEKNRKYPGLASAADEYGLHLG